MSDSTRGLDTGEFDDLKTIPTHAISDNGFFIAPFDAE